jgi:starch phosphorylase
VTYTAYFSAEIGFSPSVPTYSGGLGILAGDHLKAASDAGLPLVAVTLLYRRGYFRQHISHEGWQQESYPTFLPEPMFEKLPQTATLTLRGRKVTLAIWRTTLTGHGGKQVPILFLDADQASNAPEDRGLTHSLYGGDSGLRILQEAILGFGGVQAVHAVYKDIRNYHLNEGHCSFVPLALLNDGASVESIRQRCHFTTHTPVPAGHDVFDYGLADSSLGALLPGNIRELAGANALSMSELALSLCGSANGVSRLHGEVARGMFPSRDIGHITNGVHHLTWVSEPMAALFDRELTGWRGEPGGLARAESLTDAGVRDAHGQAKRKLLTYANAESHQGFDESIFTIGFARRAATYKRATLLLHDVERLKRICGGKVQFIFAGKAHPRDEAGHRLIQALQQAGLRLGDDIRLGYLNNYTMLTGALITAGVDLWLNTPIRPHEASGTSGMKATLNGVPSASISDGWWAEAVDDGRNGWTIGDPSRTDDASDADSLYRLLEEKIIPTYYEKSGAWTQIMKRAIATGAQFTAARMVDDYATKYYGVKK